MEDAVLCFVSLVCFSLSLCSRRPKNLPAEDCRPLPSMACQKKTLRPNCCRSGERAARRDLRALPLDAAPAAALLQCGGHGKTLATSVLAGQCNV